MKRLVVILLVLFIGFWATGLRADIYTWTDENGVQHFTNVDPPKQAELMIKAANFTTDEKAAQEAIEARRLERQQLELEEVAQKQNLISMQQEAIQEQIDAANRRAQEAEEALKRCRKILDDAAGSNGDYNGYRDCADGVVVTGTPYGYDPCYEYYPRYRYYPSYGYNSYYSYRGHFRHGLKHRGHFKHRGSHHFKKRHFGHTGKHNFRHFKKHRFGGFHHAKARHGFKGRGHHFTGHSRGGHHSKAHFRGGHNSRGSFRGGIALGEDSAEVIGEVDASR